MTPLFIIKIGGHIIDDPPALARFLDDFARVPGPKILVHGGGKKATALATQLGIATRMHQGRRITDAATLEVAVMVYAGLVNKTLVAGLLARSCKAIGFCGADAGCMPAVKRAVGDVDFGFVGDILPERLNASFFHGLLDQGLVPVLSPITHDGRGQLLNTNADTMASALAIALATHCEVQLIYCFEKKGVLRDVDDGRSLIPEIDYESYEYLKRTQIVSAGMIPKLDNAFAAVRGGVAGVVIGEARYLQAIVAGDKNTATRLMPG